MAFGFGDLVPYNQLPSAVAGQEAQANAESVNQGALSSAKVRSAEDEADAADMNNMLMKAKAPSALILSNLKDAQSINHMPIKASYDDLEEAHKKVMGDSQEKPSLLEQKKIMSLADEMAQERVPKYNPNDPTDWLSNQSPTSNQEMTLVRAQAVLDGRQNIAAGNLDLRERKFDYQKEQDPIREAGKDRRAGTMFGPPGSVPLKVQKDARSIISGFDKSQAGMMVNSPYADKRVMMDPVRGKGIRAQIVQTLHELRDTGDTNKLRDFYSKVKEFIPEEPMPDVLATPKVFKNKTPGSRSPDDATAMQEVQPTANGLTQKPQITPLGDDQQAPAGTKQVVTVGHKVYGVGDKVMIGGKAYYVTAGDGKRGGFSLSPPGAE